MLVYKRIRMRRVTNRLMARQNYFAATTFFQDYQSFWVLMAVLFPLSLLLLLLEYLNRKRSFRNHPRNCKSCGKPLQKLDEKADDDFLKKSQVFEEQLHSVDYDVWHCRECNNIEPLNYINRFSKYEPCPSCGTRAFYTESRRTLSSPTYTSTGTGQQTDRCKFCHHVLLTSYSVARLTPPSESRSSSSSSEGSSGGSWGGGHSGGGGASSSW